MPDPVRVMAGTGCRSAGRRLPVGARARHSGLGARYSHAQRWLATPIHVQPVCADAACILTPRLYGAAHFPPGLSDRISGCAQLSMRHASGYGCPRPATSIHAGLSASPAGTSSGRMPTTGVLVASGRVATVIRGPPKPHGTHRLGLPLSRTRCARLVRKLLLGLPGECSRYSRLIARVVRHG